MKNELNNNKSLWINIKKKIILKHYNYKETSINIVLQQYLYLF